MSNETPGPGQAGARRWLAPHERWLADSGARRGPAQEGTLRWRAQQNYGPDGIALLIAGSADTFCGWLIGMAGIVWLVVDGGASSGADWLVTAGCLIALAGLVRSIQAARAGRSYRDGRPFLRAGGARR
jgi:hypothetical protein